jgi:hypothetical protein
VTAATHRGHVIGMNGFLLSGRSKLRVARLYGKRCDSYGADDRLRQTSRAAVSTIQLHFYTFVNSAPTDNWVEVALCL